MQKKREKKKMVLLWAVEMYTLEITSGFQLSENMFNWILFSKGVECKYIQL